MFLAMHSNEEKSVKIRTKLTVSILLPLIALVVIGSVSIRGSWQQADAMAKIERLTTFTARVSALVHETQKERGNTAGYLGSKGEKFGDRLSEQREVTDGQIEQLETFLKGFDPSEYGQGFAESLSKATALLPQIDQQRTEITELKTTTPKAIGYYTQMNSNLLDTVVKAATVTRDGSIASRLIAYSSFLKSKERAGIERAVLSNTFARDSFGKGMYEKFTALVALQNAYLTEFGNQSNPQDEKFYTETLENECVEQVNAFRQVAMEKNREGGFGVEASVWFDTITKKINLLKQVDDHLATGLLKEAKSKSATAWQSLLSTSGILGLIISITVAVGVFSIRSVLGRLSQIVDRVRDIAEGEGDLTKRLTVSSDEIGELAGWFNRFMDKIEGTVQGIIASSSDLRDSSEELNKTSTSLNKGARESQQQVSTIASAAEEMSINMKQAASSTEQMSSGITSLSDSVGSISNAITEIADRSNQSTSIAQTAATYVEVSNERIDQLRSAAEEIGNVIEVIEDIASQTNLLALNATIEAARAGEAGKGFAVVATEVKELAQQTSTATEGIRSRVLSMQTSTSEAVKAMSDIEQAIGEVNDISSDIAEAVDQQSRDTQEIAASVEQTAASSSAISQGVAESAVASQEITESVSVVDRIMQETVSGAESTNNAGARVAELAVKLQVTAGEFHVSETDTSAV